MSAISQRVMVARPLTVFAHSGPARQLPAGVYDVIDTDPGLVWVGLDGEQVCVNTEQPDVTVINAPATPGGAL